MEIRRNGSMKQGPCSHRKNILLLKLCLPLYLIKFWYQLFSSYPSLPLQHAWNCTALSIIYSLSFAYCFLWMPSTGHLPLCCLWYDAPLHVAHCSGPPPLQVWVQLICWHWLRGATDFLFFNFIPSLPLSPNDSTVICYEGWVLMSWICNAGGRCSGTEGVSEDGAVGDVLADGGAEGPLWPCHEGVRRTQLQQPDRQSCVPTKGGYLVKLHSFKMQNQPCLAISCILLLIFLSGLPFFVVVF